MVKDFRMVRGALIGLALILAQGCSDNPSMAQEEDTNNPPVDQSSSSAFSASSSSSASSAPVTEQGYNDARRFVERMNNAVSEGSPSALLDGADGEQFDLFLTQVQSSEISGQEVLNVLQGVYTAGLAFGAVFLEDEANQTVIPIPEGVSVDGYSVVRSSTLLEQERYYSFVLDQEIILDPRECSGGEASCIIQVSVDWELALPNSRPWFRIGDDFRSVVLTDMEFNITHLEASNQYVSISVTPGEKVISAGELLVEALLDADLNLINTLIEVNSLTGALSFEINELQNIRSLSSGLFANLPRLKVDIGTVAVDGLVLNLLELGDSSLSGEWDLQSDNQSLAGDITAEVQMLGNGPFSYVLGDTIEAIGEDAENFLGANVSLSYTHTADELLLFGGEMRGARKSDQLLEVENFSLNYNDLTYLLSGEVNNSGQLRLLEAVDAQSSVRVSLDATSGITLGGVVDGTGTSLGSVNKAQSGALEILYTDGSNQEFLPGVKVPAPFLPSESF